jgi:N-acetylneuraminic acid mutarotase
LLTVTLDFGAGVFTGPARWLEIGVRTNGSAGGYSALHPRQPVAASPYATTAGNVTGPINGGAILGGTITSAQLAAGAVTAANIASNSITAGQLASGAAAANLNSSGQSGAPSGIILSSDPNSAELLNAGYIKIGQTELGDFWQTRGLAASPSARYAHTAVWTGSEMIVWGGYGGAGFLNQVGRYNPAGNNWTAVSTTGAPAGRFFHSAVWTGSEMIVWGGSSDYLSTFLNNGGRYNPAGNSWAAMSTTGAPSGRYAHTAVWTGSEMVVWGGGTVSFFNTGGRYDPLSDTWTQTAVLNAPEGRVGHRAVWTGSVMVIWGGSSILSRLDTGGRYDPVSDSWTPTTTDSAPEARSDYTAVWTGSLMVVWGGLDSDFTPLNTGGRYDPVADTWAPTTTVNAPMGRNDHTAVWTGSVMVVWGGLRDAGKSAQFFKTGGRYDPLSNTWAPTSTAPAPRARAWHTAVWTGSVMVIWGGKKDVFSGYLSTGGRYDPVADAWTPTATLNAPEPRFNHTAVWGGSRVVVWGGAESSSEFNTGGRYDPVADAWAPTTTANAPEAREYHTAVWTGSAMLVWGGLLEGVQLDTGGRYGLFPTCASWWRPAAKK